MDKEKIVIKDLGVNCIIGVHPWERDRPSMLLVDIELGLSANHNDLSDQLHDTVDYAALAELIVSEAARTRFNLIETLARHLIKVCRQSIFLEHLNWVKIRVKKPDALRGMGAAQVLVELRTRLSDWD